MPKKQHTISNAAPWLMVVGFFMLLIAPKLLSRGMFMDGLIYCGLAENLAHGDGSAWQMHITPCCFSTFYEHPPLMMWLMSGWFRFVGGGYVAAKMYGLIVYLIAGWLIVCLYRALGGGKSTMWLPLLLWTLVPPVTIHLGNSLLETTMLVFVLGAVLCMLQRKHEWLFHLMAGLLLCAAFLTKGFTGLFPLALPFLLWVFRMRDMGFWRMVGHTLVAVALLVVPVGLLCLCNPQAANYLDIYLHHQVMGGVHVQVVDSRWHCVGHYFLHTAIVWGLTLAVLLWALWRRQDMKQLPWRTSLTMLVLGLCGVVPMMVSTKQRDFYLLTAYPMLVLSMAMLLAPYAERVLRWLQSKVAVGVGGAMVLVAVVLMVVNAGGYCRDRDMQADMDVILPHLQEGEQVDIPRSMRYEYSLLCYYWLEKHIALCPDTLHTHYLTDGSAPAAEGYVEVSLPTRRYKLYRRQ